MQKKNRNICPDGGTCHHSCPDGSLVNCFRVACCAPLSGVYVNDHWPEFERPAPVITKHLQITVQERQALKLVTRKDGEES